MRLRARCVSSVAALLVGGSVPAAPGASAQTLEVSQAFVDLPAPDLADYDAERSRPAAFTLSVTSCGAAGCEVTLENPQLASSVAIELEWRLLDVGQVGEGDADCSPAVALSAWQTLGAAPVPIMETGPVSAGLACVASVEVRARDLAWSVHELTTPATAYWRELGFRAVER